MPQILVVQHEAISLGLVECALRLDGHAIQGTGDPTQAIALMRQHQFGLVIADLVMKRPGGVVLLKHMNQEGVDAPILFISECPALAQVLKSGMGRDAVIERPFSADQLRSTVSRILAAWPFRKQGTRLGEGKGLRRGTRPVASIPHLIIDQD